MNNPNIQPQPGEPPQGYPPPQSILVKPPSVRPLITYTMMAACIIIYLLQIASGFVFAGDLPAALGAKLNEWILRGELWRLFTPMFLHGSIIHIAFNMYALYNLGPALERFYGHKRYLALYVLSGFAGNVISFMFSPNPSLGSSTAIFGLLGAEGVFLYQNRELFGSNARRGFSQVISIAVINLLIGMTPGIDNWGHIGGLIGGTLFAWFAGPQLRLEGIFPTFTFMDKRASREVLVAGWGVGGLFVLLTAAVFLMRI